LIPIPQSSTGFISGQCIIINTMRQIPHILRARNYRLYLADGRRLVDLWLNGGAAVLGHTPPNLLREIKNTASRGLYAPLPHFTEGRLLKALTKLFPGRSFRIYATPPWELFSGDTDLHGLNGLARIEEGEREGASLKLWRPYVNHQNPFYADDTPLLVPVLPGIQAWRGGLPMGLCVVAAQTGTGASEAALSLLPPSDTLPPVLLAVAARGIHDLLAAPERAKPEFPRIKKALRESRWQRQGIYLTLKEEPKEGEWDALFDQFFEAGFLLPPTPDHPLILPGELSQGEEAKLAAVLYRQG